MAAKKKATKAVSARDAAELRVIQMARRWAKPMREREVLSSEAHWLLRAVDKLEALDCASNSSPKEGG